jgi:hypothetical protein
MRKLIILLAVLVTTFVFATDLTEVDVSFSAWTTMTSTTVSADATYTIALPEFLKKIIILDTTDASITSGTVTFYSGDYGDAVLGNLVTTPATNGLYCYTPWAMRLQDEDGDVTFFVDGLQYAKIYVIEMP